MRAIGRDIVAWSAVAVLARIVFWIVTDRTWEDALITIAHARNAVAGIGLTHHPGEPVTHGFTSALSVLVPLLGELVARDAGLVLVRLVSLVAAVATVVAADRICRRLGIGRAPRIMVLAYLALDLNHIFYGMAGMETQLAVAILLWSVEAAMASGAIRSGVTYGLSLLARPDFAIWVASALLDRIARDRRGAVVAGAAALIVVAPWVVFTTLYYGSPIPQTIIAKAGLFVTPPPAGAGPIEIAGWLATTVVERLSAVLRTFAPFFEDTHVVAAPLPLLGALYVSIVVWALAIGGALTTWRVPGWRAAVLFAAGFTVYRAVLLPTAYFDWYVPPHSAVLIILAAAGVERLRPLRWVDPRRVLAGAVAVAMAVHYPFTLAMERAIQRDIENAVRRPIGEELARVVPPGRTVATEPVGYLGYYSNALLIGYPGLTSRRALEIMQELPADRRDGLEFFNRAEADFMALRAEEWTAFRQIFPATAARYEEIARFASPPGTIQFDAQGRRRIEVLGLRKDASSSEMLILRRITP